MKIIHKQTINLLDNYYSIQVPMSARVISIQHQSSDEIASVWYEFHTEDNNIKGFRFAIVNTGDVFKEGHYLATIQLNNGRLIRHIYQIND